MDTQKNPKTSLAAQSASHEKAKVAKHYPIIVHSHLGWDWVWQRPQQFLSRFSKDHRVLFVEGPVPDDSLEWPKVSLREVSDYPNIMVLQSRFPASHWEDGDWVDKQRRRLVQRVLAGPLGAKFVNAVQWFYDPMAVTAFAGKMGEIATVYDCMDQLSQFRGAPPELVRRERELLAVADVVFAGGPKIHRAKKLYNANCHSYGCGVDVLHFAQAQRVETVVPDDIAHIKGPVLGFFGVVDERMDYELVAALADANPFWHLVIVGPRTKVEDEVLPRRHNIHWLGGRDYALLPHYAKRFDLCMMPFAINEATEYINPTKALEYMATGRPIVSTAIEDVVSQFSHVTQIAHSHEEFIAFCYASLERPDAEQVERGIALANSNSWEAIVEKLKGHIDEVLAENGPAEKVAAGSAA